MEGAWVPAPDIKAKHWRFADPTQKSRSSRMIGTGTFSRWKLRRAAQVRSFWFTASGRRCASKCVEASLPNFFLNCWLVSLIDDRRWCCCHLEANLPVRLIDSRDSYGNAACICLHCTALHRHCFLYYYQN